MIRKLLIILVVIFISSCTSDTIYKKPKDLIPPDEMVNLLTDIYLANASASIPNKLEGRNIQYLPLVYKKYKIDSARFNHSNVYYLSRIKEYKFIQQKVLKRLKILNNKYKILSSKIDSVNRLRLDSIKKGLKKRKIPTKVVSKKASKK